MDEILLGLNPDQIKPVTDTEGAVLVLAGAGSGKTRVLTSRIAYILREGKARLSQILAITFTNKAANEMKERIAALLGDGNSRWICTIHSMCVKILREYSVQAGLNPNFSIYSETERANVIKKAVKEVASDDEKLLKSAKFHIANAKMLGLDPEQYGIKYAYERGIEVIVRVYKIYNAHLKENNALDFDDLLLETLRLLRGNSEVLEYLSDKFRYIHVDEFQDINSVQYAIIKMLSTVHGNIFAVGDDDQSIYGWRGAEVENILRFDKDFKGAKVYKLERNYRSTKNILNLANAIIRRNVSRRGKELWTDAEEGPQPVYYQAEEEAEEALYTARVIAEGVGAGRKYSDYAVLMRINALTRSYEQEFTKYGIPYKVFGGFRFFERKEIKDILAYLRLIANPFDSEAAERIINVPRRGIGGKTIEVMYDYARQNDLSLYDAAVDCEYLPLPNSAKEKLKGFAGLIKDLTVKSLDTPVGELVRQLLKTANLRSAYDDGTDEGDVKLANIDEFIASVDDFARLNPQAGLNEYLNQVTLYSDLDEMDDGNYVTIATIHAVKGLEFPYVFICGLEEGIMPSSRSESSERDLEEERRLMYVAVTRAKKGVYLTRSKSRYLYGRRADSAPSVFIKEITEKPGLILTKPNTSRDYSSRYSGGGYRSGNRYGYGGGKYSYDDSGYTSDDTPSYSYNSGAFGGQTQKAQSGFKPYFEQQQKPAVSQNNGKYTVGMKVKHPKFGIGMIIAVKNDGNALNIAFENQGIKELSASLAPLTILK